MKNFKIEKVREGVFDLIAPETHFILYKGTFAEVECEETGVFTFEKIKKSGWTLRTECFNEHFQTKKEAIKRFMFINCEEINKG